MLKIGDVKPPQFKVAHDLKQTMQLTGKHMANFTRESIEW